LAPLGQVVSAGTGSLDELLALIDVTFAGLVFVGLDREQVVAQSALIEGALEAKPMLAIVAFGDGMDNQLVLNAMRAGARDFVAYGSRSSEVAGLVRRLSKRLPPVDAQCELGGLSVYCITAMQCRRRAAGQPLGDGGAKERAERPCFWIWACPVATAWRCWALKVRSFLAMPCGICGAWTAP
jgi:hypothetical protein